MKKVIFTLVIVCFAALYSQAQFKPEGGSFTTELQFSPLNANPFSEMGLRGRYFFNENLALRVNLDFGLDNTKSVTEVANVETTSKTKESNFGIAAGIEYHMADWERVSPYIGGELFFNTNGSKETVDSDNFSSEIINGGAARTGLNTFGINVVLGTDFYIVEGLYMGAELRLGFGMNSAKAGEDNSTVGNTPTNMKYDNKVTGMNLGFNVMPQIRLGWRF